MVLSTKTETSHQGGVNDNNDEADGKMFVNSFPEFENDKDFEIKLSLSLTSLFSSTVCKFLRLRNVWRDHCVALF